MTSGGWGWVLTLMRSFRSAQGLEKQRNFLDHRGHERTFLGAGQPPKIVSRAIVVPVASWFKP